MKRICVFAGSSKGVRPEYREAARALGHVLGARGIGVVYGAGGIGLMGVLADAVLENGGEITGVIPDKLMDMEVAHEGITELRVVRTMHERKALMAELSDGFITLPGGLGTLEETMEMITWLQLGYHAKPVGLLNIRGYYDPLLAFFRHMNEEGFISERILDSFTVDDAPEGLVRRMLTPR
ncbi:MAG: TIGR00730 family Rossman fold protein [Nitrospinae bacterium]|nr:TIGR00730 family Rossman fold protein [Nitrospinota bacterium]